MANISKIKTLDGTVYTINDDNAVHKTGDETIAGEKTLSDNTTISKSNPMLSLQMLNLDTTQVSSSNKFYSAIGFCDKNGLEFKNRTALIRSGMSSSDSNFIQICAVNPTTDSTAVAHLGVYYSRDGHAKAVAPSTLTADELSDSTMSPANTDIITRDFIPKDTRIVHTTGDEEIAGEKSFINDIKISSAKPNLYMTIDDNTKGTLPSSSNIRGIGWYDGSGSFNNNHKYGGVQNWLDSSGLVKTYLLAFNNVSGSSTSGELGVKFDAGSTIPYAYAPSTPDTGGTTDIITRDYLNNHKVEKTSWSNTKLYDVTLTEAATASVTDPYTLTTTEFGTGYKELFIRLAVATAQPTAATLRFKVVFNNSYTLKLQISNGISTSASNYVCVRAGNYDCLLFGSACRSTGNPSIAAWYSMNGSITTHMPQFAGIDDTITKIEIWSTSSTVTQLPSGMNIMIWGRK